MYRQFLLLIITALVLTSCKDENTSEENALDQAPITFTKEGELNIIKVDSSTKALDIEFAETEYETSTGLMYRESMEGNQGMLFIFQDERPHNFYMKNTYIPLDLFFITKDKKIATIIENAMPLDESNLPSEVPVTYVLETNAGFAKEWNIKEGDSVSWTRN
ncbi:DUF192 domain-containing protein [Leeuwenhoekiella sp. MAR_2009_132]|uniref:DUF192 domain-containing protein n=1 Tax=Leeuwenhoekiella sp. MAR_2009_132 TaxID=1392489 RepID=UPI0004920D40|nr:DUF192 domain-containing protein [Leeuwenhoekiella sp. MAR_2009_132]